MTIETLNHLYTQASTYCSSPSTAVQKIICQSAHGTKVVSLHVTNFAKQTFSDLSDFYIKASQDPNILINKTDEHLKSSSSKYLALGLLNVFFLNQTAKHTYRSLANLKNLYSDEDNTCKSTAKVILNTTVASITGACTYLLTKSIAFAIDANKSTLQQSISFINSDYVTLALDNSFATALSLTAIATAALALPKLYRQCSSQSQSTNTPLSIPIRPRVRTPNQSKPSIIDQRYFDLQITNPSTLKVIKFRIAIPKDSGQLETTMRALFTQPQTRTAAPAA